jgi:hypothetical protein
MRVYTLICQIADLCVFSVLPHASHLSRSLHWDEGCDVLVTFARRKLYHIPNSRLFVGNCNIRSLSQI